MINSTDKYKEHKFNMLIWVLPVDDYIYIYNGKMENYCPKVTKQNKSQKAPQQKQKQKNNKQTKQHQQKGRGGGDKKANN